jgi:synaptotagmin-1
MSESEDSSHRSPSPGICSCCCGCLQACFSREDKKKFAGVEYELVPTIGEGIIFNNLPEPDVQKRFTLPQAKTEYAVPIQLGTKQEQKVVRKQPRRDRSISEPTLPPGYVPDPSMFEFNKTPVTRSSSVAARVMSDSYRSSPRTSPHRGSPPYSVSPPSIGERQMSAPATFSHSDLDSTSWRPSLSAIKDVEEPEEGAAGKGLEGLIRNVPPGSALPPEIEFSLYYDIQCRTLMVHLQCARFLPLRVKKAGLNPIVLLYLLPNREDIFQSKMVENTSNPVFNQSFEFTGLMPDEIRRQTLIFRVFSHSSKGDLLGGLSISLSEADLFGVMCRRNIDTDIEKLKLVSRGDLLLSLTHNPSTQKLQGLLLKATNLQKQDIVGLADPYVKIWLLKKGRRNQKWKSKVKRNTLIPIFNEPFQFDLSEINIKDAALEIMMMDYDRFSRNDIVGVIYIGGKVPHDTGRQHWEQLLSHPNTSISSWHTILPITALTSRTTRRKKVSQAISSQYTEEEEDD